jgi:O-Antigen ligase
MDFFLFILLNAAFFVRLPELFPGIDFPIYVYVMYACLAACATQIHSQLGPLSRTPIGACVFGLPVAGALSHISHVNLAGTTGTVNMLVRLLCYYLVLVAVINRYSRLRSFLGWLVALTVVVTTLSVLHYNGVIYIDSLKSASQNDIDPDTGREYVIPRMCSTGVFNDPNDLSIMLVFVTLVCVYFFDSTQGFRRFLWLGPMALFVYGLKLTYSRGGLLNLGISLGVLSVVRHGWKKSLFVGVLALPLLAALFGGRQTRFDIGNSESTSQGRVGLWIEAFALFKGAPLFGIGVGVLVSEITHVAHNSFVQTYVEQGFFGGTLFSGGFYSALYCVYRFLLGVGSSLDPALRRIGTYIPVFVFSYCIGMYSLSRSETILTYMFLGIPTAFLQIASAQSLFAPLQLDARYVRRLCLVSFVWLVFLHVFCRVMVLWK